MASETTSDKLLSVIGESRWLLVLGAAIYFIAALYGYHPADPAWSHAVDADHFRNPCGLMGAYLSDLLLYLFGFSAWWIVLFMISRVWLGYCALRQKEGMVFSRRNFWISVVGFLVLLLASSSLESIRMYNLNVVLPDEPGGVVGMVLGNFLATFFGFTGATLFLLVAIATSFSVFSGLSWLRFIDFLGAVLELVYFKVSYWVQTAQDRRIGKRAVSEREAQIEEEKKRRVEEYVPAHFDAPIVNPDAYEPIDVVSVSDPDEPDDAAVVAPVAKKAAVPVKKTLPAVAAGTLPSLDLLDQIKRQLETIGPDTLEFTARLIEHKLKDFGVEVKVVSAFPGPVITRYEIEPATGVKGSQVLNLGRDLARALSVVNIRILETIPGKTFMALELPNPKRQIVSLNEILSSQPYQEMSSPLTMAMGKDISGKPIVADLAKMPHVLVAGTTGSGKSVAINAMILSLLYKSTPQQVRLLMVDPKMLELSVYEGIPHLLAPVITDMRQAASGLNWCVQEMDKRYRLMAHVGVRNIAGYNEKIREMKAAGQVLTNPFSLTPDHPEPLDELPFIVVFIDELADLMMVVGKKIEELIARLAQKARAAGIHLVLATQRPSVDVITGLIKANVPTRVAFQVSSKIDSRTILDQMGAETLLGQGDMLYLPPGTGYPLRVHGAFVSDQEVHRVAEFLKAQGEPQYIDGVLEAQDESEAQTSSGGAGGGADAESDPLYDQAVDIVLKNRRASISLVQRHLRIGYNRAARLIEQMEKAGLVSAMQTNGNRDVIAPARQEE